MRVPDHLGGPLRALREHVIGGDNGAEGHRIVALGPVVGGAPNEDSGRVLPAQGVMEEEAELGELLVMAKQFSGGGVATEGDHGEEGDEDQEWSPHGVLCFCDLTGWEVELSGVWHSLLL